MFLELLRVINWDKSVEVKEVEERWRVLKVNLVNSKLKGYVCHLEVRKKSSKNKGNLIPVFVLEGKQLYEKEGQMEG